MMTVWKVFGVWRKERGEMRIIFPIVGHIPYTIQLANALSKTEKIMLLIPRNDFVTYSALIEKNVEVRTFYMAKRHRYPTNLFGICEIIKYIKKFNPDIVHLQSGDFWLCFILPLLKKYPIITTVHDPELHLGEERLHAKVIAYITRIYTNHTIVHSKKLREVMIEKYQIPSGDAHVISHGEYSFFKRWIRTEIGEVNNSILFFGRIWPYKGLDYLIKAQPLITKEIPDAKIIIAGKGENFKKYEKLMINRDAFIVYNQFIPNEMVAELFQKVSVVVLPYIDATQSGVIPIAYAFKKPVVATKVGGIPEVVESGRTGYLVPPRNTEELAEAIVKLLKNKEERKRMGENAYEKMKKEMSWDEIAKKTMNVYRMALRDINRWIR